MFTSIGENNLAASSFFLIAWFVFRNPNSQPEQKRRKNNTKKLMQQMERKPLKRSVSSREKSKERGRVEDRMVYKYTGNTKPAALLFFNCFQK